MNVISLLDVLNYIRSDQLYCHVIVLQQNIGMGCNVGSSYKYVHVTIHSQAPIEYNKIML